MPTFSIITPSFRQAAYLSRCARSVADQTGNFTHEHLVQDGGGGSEFEAWRSTQAFAHVVSEPDSGMYDAINRGFHRADGEILAWLNCDEQYLPGALAKVSKWFQENPEKDILFGDIILVATDGSPLSYRKAILPLRQHIRNCFLPTYSAATFVRRRILEEGHVLDTRFRAIADAVWIDELLLSGYKAGILNEPLAVFTQTGENLGQTPISIAEGELWARESGQTSSFKKHFWSSIHRIRKMLHGCYQKHDVDVSLYVDSDAGRTSCKTSLDGRWHTSPASPAISQHPSVLPKVAAVFASYNRKETALECIRHLREQSHSTYQVVVGENASGDGTAEALAALQWEKLEVLNNGGNLGNAGGVRAAMDHAFQNGADAVWILDDDSWPDTHALEKLLAGEWQPHVVRHSVQIDPRNGKYSWPLPLTGKHPRAKTLRDPEEWPGDEAMLESRAAWTGALIPRKIWETVGPVLDTLFIRGEDEEYPRRISAAGFHFHAVRDSILLHPSANGLICWSMFGKQFWYELGLTPWKLYYEARNTIWVKCKYQEWFHACGITVLFAFALLVYGPRTMDHFKALSAAFRDAWTGRLGKKEF